jgi:RimJ/RimL family protein N-acetyltransferase
VADAPGAAVGDAPLLNIVGEKVALGPLRKDLVPTYLRWMNDFNTLRTLGVLPAPMLLEQEEQWYQRRVEANGNSVFFTIYVCETGQAIGNTSLDVDRVNRAATFGILIGEPEARGKGYGTEATRLMLDYAFTALGLHHVMLNVYEYNLAGQRAYARAGFKEVGRLRQAHFMGGRQWDVVVMDCIAAEFESPLLAKLLVADEPR